MRRQAYKPAIEGKAGAGRSCARVVVTMGPMKSDNSKIRFLSLKRDESR